MDLAIPSHLPEGGSFDPEILLGLFFCKPNLIFSFHIDNFDIDTNLKKK